ncbi:MAG: ABC transporter permease [Anaerolineae bacterium]|nr:ABC transporter permease [Anaerolineae bacterium]
MMSATASDKPIAQLRSQPRIEAQSLSEMTWKRFRRHRLGLVSVAVLALIVASAILAPALKPEGYSKLDPRIRYESPTAAHVMGTDALGRDIFTRLLYGGQTSLTVSVVAVSISFFIGVTLGAVSGYFGSWVDITIQRVVEIVASMPALIIILSFVAVYGANIYNTMLILGLFGWTGLCRFVRGQVLQIREMDFVLASRSVGGGNRHIIMTHVLPNVVPYLTVSLAFAFSSTILLETSLSYLGLGVQAPTPSWGNMVGDASSMLNLRDRWWLWMPAGVAITLTVLSINFIGDALRDALDPHTSID